MIPHSNDYCNEQPFYSLCILRHAMQMNEKQQKGRGKYHACCTTYILETRGAFLVCKNNNLPRALDWTSHGIDKNFIELTTIFTRDLPSTFLYFPVAPAIWIIISQEPGFRWYLDAALHSVHALAVIAAVFRHINVWDCLLITYNFCIISDAGDNI